jgi:hypothetical protein
MSDPQATAGSAAAEQIVPRAEFRVFGRNVIETVQPRIWDCAAVLLGRREMPAETYFLSAGTLDANVKLRGGLLDIKVRVGETAEGYEIYQPRGKYRFPVQQAELANILAQLGVAVDLAEEVYAAEAVIDLARRHPQLVPVTVEKERYGFTVDGVLCEYARVWFNGAEIQTACVESEDHAAMPAVIERLGLTGLANTSYLRAARRVVGLE